MKTIEMELAVAQFFNWRVNTIVPNLSWGMGLHECDLLIITPQGYATEVEIKISLSDLKKDQLKEHKHNDKRIKRLYFAIPESLLKHSHLIPERAGILVVRNIDVTQNVWDTVKINRHPQVVNEGKFTEDEIKRITKLGTMRIWPLKKKIINNFKSGKN